MAHNLKSTAKADAFAVPNNMQEAITALAAVWVERWLAHGGWLAVEAEGRPATLGMRMLGAAWRSKSPFGDRLWHDGWKAGRWRELSEMSDYVPGLHAAISRYVFERGTVAEDGARTMVRAVAEMGAV